jgi:hypothetical protein
VLRAYGAAVAKQIIATGATVGAWDLGNEVEYGVAGVAVRPMPGGCDASAGATGEYQAPDAVNRNRSDVGGDAADDGHDASHRMAQDVLVAV